MYGKGKVLSGPPEKIANNGQLADDSSQVEVTAEAALFPVNTCSRETFRSFAGQSNAMLLVSSNRIKLVFESRWG